MQAGQESQKDQEIEEEQKIARTVHTEKTGGHEVASWLLVFFPQASNFLYTSNNF